MYRSPQCLLMGFLLGNDISRFLFGSAGKIFWIPFSKRQAITWMQIGVCLILLSQLFLLGEGLFARLSEMPLASVILNRNTL